MQYSMDGMTWQGSGGGPSPWLDFEIKRLTRRDFRLGTLNGLPVVSTPVDLDIDNSRQLAQAILNAGTGATSVVVDMTAVDFIEGYSRSLFVMSTLPGKAASLHEGWPVSRKDVVTTTTSLETGHRDASYHRVRP
jgi:hypothetical protein